MPDARDVSTTRPGLSTGAWATISAAVVALIGAGVTLLTTWWSPHHAAASPPIVTAQAPPTLASTETKADPGVAGLVGHWKGTAELSGQPAQKVEVEIAANCAPGGACGWIAVPDVPCKGQISLVGPDPNGFEFQVDRFDASSSPQRCQPGGGEVLRANGDGTVTYTATYSGARGVLRPAS